MIFTTSWDDGSTLDLKLVELLNKHDIKGTFYLPLCNRERGDHLTAEQMRGIGGGFEIGCHTYHHVPLVDVSLSDAEKEVARSKLELQNILGRAIEGFCFPRGKFSKKHIGLIQRNGFKYARTINMFVFENTPGFLMNTTLQVMDHKKSTYFKHLFKRGRIREWVQFREGMDKYGKWNDLFKYLIEHPKIKFLKRPVFHLWGHSWEIEKYGQWNELEDLFDYINGLDGIIKKSNGEIMNGCKIQPFS